MLAPHTLQVTLGGESARYRFLRQAMAARRCLLLIDGIDEGGHKKLEIETHLTKVLAPQGHLMLVTSRPAGLTESLYGDFEQLKLLPLTFEQQKEVVEMRLKTQDLTAEVPKLLDYINDYVPRDTVTGERITGNPLMLSMVVSIYEGQALARRDDAKVKVGKQRTRRPSLGESSSAGGGKAAAKAAAKAAEGMPEKMVDLYEMAVGTMLARVNLKERGSADGLSVAEVRAVLQLIALDAHVAKVRASLARGDPA